MKTKQFQSVSQMIEALSENPDFVKAAKQDADERGLVSHLFALRCVKDISQEELAKHLGCSQGRISKLESATDRKLRLGDVVDYASALDMELRIVIAPKSTTVADEVRYHWACVKRLLDSMVDLAKLKRRRSKNGRQIAVEVMNVDGCETHRSAPDDAVAV